MSALKRSRRTEMPARSTRHGRMMNDSSAIGKLSADPQRLPTGRRRMYRSPRSEGVWCASGCGQRNSSRCESMEALRPSPSNKFPRPCRTWDTWTALLPPSGIEDIFPEEASISPQRLLRTNPGATLRSRGRHRSNRTPGPAWRPLACP